MSSTCFEPVGSSSGRQLYIQLWYATFYMHQNKQCSMQKSVFGTITLLSHTIPHHTIPYHNCIYNRLPENEPSGSKRVEDTKKLKIRTFI
jgi:hypothetical protein